MLYKRSVIKFKRFPLQTKRGRKRKRNRRILLVILTILFSLFLYQCCQGSTALPCARYGMGDIVDVNIKGNTVILNWSNGAIGALPLYVYLDIAGKDENKSWELAKREVLRMCDQAFRKSFFDWGNFRRFSGSK